ncbi:MAG: hypothetical protein HFI75_15405 [Lachnospiraceae bacterium]|nr:hypothetical protein [Lachnospiraceae bacterium]
MSYNITSGLPEDEDNLTPVYATPTPMSVICERETEAFTYSQKSNLLNERSSSIALLNYLNIAIDTENGFRDEGNKLSPIKELPHLSIAMMIAARGDVALVSGGDKSGQNKKQLLTLDKKLKLPIGIYQDSGDNKGVWEVTNSPDDSFGVLAEKYKPTATKKDKAEIFALTKSRLPVISTCCIPYYAAFENGIWDDLNKTLIPFSKDLVFTSKCHTNLNVNAKNPYIQIPEDGSTWDVDTWLNELGDADMVKVIKEVIAASMLINTSFDKMILFYASSGCNSKGTIAQLIRNILGEETVVSIPLNEFSKSFGLSKLPGANAIIVDENPVSDFSKGLDKLKAVITKDVVSVNQKYIQEFDYRFNGLVIECINDMVNTNDKTNSFLRRLHIVPFDKTFVGNPKKYIKDRLIYMDEVKEYIVKMVMVDMPYFDSFTETPATKRALAAYLDATNAAVAYLNEILPLAQWDLLPGQDFLYSGFKTWYKNCSPSGKVCGRTDFYDSVRAYINSSALGTEWEWTDSCRSSGYIDPTVKEPLLIDLELTEFINPIFAPGSPKREYPDVRKIKTKYSGLKRRIPVAMSAANGTMSTPPDTEED